MARSNATHFAACLFFRRLASTCPCEQLLVALRGLSHRVLRSTRSLAEHAAAPSVKVVAVALAVKIARTTSAIPISGLRGSVHGPPVAYSGKFDLKPVQSERTPFESHQSPRRPPHAARRGCCGWSCQQHDVGTRAHYARSGLMC